MLIRDFSTIIHVRTPLYVRCSLFQILGDLTELSYMPTNRRFLLIAFTSVALGTMATFGFAKLKMRIGLITNRFKTVSLT